MSQRFTFTSESVTEGHPDKVADQISDGVLDAILAEDPHARVACETMCTTGLVVVAGEISTHAYVEIPRIVRDTLSASGVGRGACVVHVHPRDAERLRGVPFRSGTEIEADPEVAEGDVHVTTPHGLLVREIDELLLAVRSRLHGELT